MNNRILLLFGIAIPLLFTTAILGLGTLVDGYSHLSETVSEIGQTGSPAELLWKFAGIAVALCFLLFSLGLYRFSRANSLSVLPACLVACFGLMTIGTSAFESPHPIHNVFGLLLTLGYMAPLALALCWRGLDWATPLVRFSWVIWVFILASIALNLSPLFTRDLFPLEYYGLVQRSLFLLFYGLWCPVVGLSLYRTTSNSSINTSAQTDISHA